jgi:tetratricopeptide (TPR) repeat protein
VRTILATFLILLLLLPVLAIGEIQTITHTVKQPFGGSQSADDARIAAIAKAKREALEIAGVYIEALTIVKDAKVDKDEILALTAGVLKSEVVSQKNYITGEGFGIEVVVKIIVDPSVLESRVKKLLQDRTYLDQLNQARKKEKELLEKMARLEKENERLMAKKQPSAKLQDDYQNPDWVPDEPVQDATMKLKKQFQETSQELTAVDWYDKALTSWSITLSGVNASSYPSEITDGGIKAIEYLSTAIKLNPDYSDAYLTRGIIYSAIGQKSLAMKDFKKVVQLEKPKDSFGYARRGSAYLGLNDYQRAIQDYDYAIQLQPDDPSYYPARGFVYIELKQYQRAIKDFDDAIRLKTDDADVYLIRANVKKILGQYDLAIKDYDEVIRLKPDYADAY